MILTLGLFQAFKTITFIRVICANKFFCLYYKTVPLVTDNISKTIADCNTLHTIVNSVWPLLKASEKLYSVKNLWDSFSCVSQMGKQLIYWLEVENNLQRVITTYCTTDNTFLQFIPWNVLESLFIISTLDFQFIVWAVYFHVRLHY